MRSGGRAPDHRRELAAALVAVAPGVDLRSVTWQNLGTARSPALKYDNDA
jgi:hypothetical protein